MKNWLVTLFSLLFILNAISQDLHFSQFYASPVYLNPGMTGVYDFDFKDKDIRATSIFRQQWKTIQSPFSTESVPFNTIIASVDGLLKHHKALDGNYVGVGGLMYQDNAGDLNYKTQWLNFSMSYGFSMNYDHTLYVTPGASVSYGVNSVDFSKGFFDNQWTGLEFDPSLPTGEVFPSDSKGYVDYSVGVSVSSFPAKRKKHTVGIALFHLNRPDQNFYNNNTSQLNLKFKAHYQGQYPLSHHRELVPVALFHSQSKVYEFTGGSLLKFILRDLEHRDIKNLQLGIAYRVVGNKEVLTSSDALLLLSRLRYRNYLFGASYDANFSGLTKATNTVGAFEISIVYYGDLYKKNRQPRRRMKNYEPVCPDE